MPKSISSYFLLIPFAVQALCMAVDEFYFHWRRKLPRWERLGHPLDTLTVVIGLGWLLCVPPSGAALAVYAGLALFSSLFVTKDEFVHREVCSAGEQWLHSMLFVWHPLVLLCAGLLWPAWHGETLSFIRYVGFERQFFLGNALLTGGFGLYQYVFWNLLWPRLSASFSVNSPASLPTPPVPLPPPTTPPPVGLLKSTTTSTTS